MSYIVHVRRKAESDIGKAQVWYENQQVGLASEFLGDFEEIITILESTPLIYEEVYRDVRRAVLHRFPYLVWFRVRGKTVSIIACTHGRRSPTSTSKHVRG